MVNGDVIVSQIEQLGFLIKGLGAFALAWIAYAVALFVIERKKMKKLDEIEKQIKRLERKIGRK
ncbi:MAG TPA: hypothetical protein VJ208_01145 [Candidatus Nanoarchaeia archaeon]|nr:hypothetical protein [Candidatus Nanoarchaeia archaeon]